MHLLAITISSSCVVHVLDSLHAAGSPGLQWGWQLGRVPMSACASSQHEWLCIKSALLVQDEQEPWDEMFSRGIDPDVMDPSKCHQHPDAPPEWPTKSEIAAYSLKVGPMHCQGWART